MDREHIKDRVYSLIQEVLDENEVKIKEESGLMDELEFSSLEIMTMISEIEDEFQIVLSENEMRKVITVGDLIEIIYAKVIK